MSLIEHTLFGVRDKVRVSIDRLKEFEPPEGYWGAFSGGKDSVAIKELARMAEVRVEWHYRHVGFDPPELIDFIKSQHVDVVRELPAVSQWVRMSRTGPATRMVRWCCDHKESGGKGRIVLTGVRHDESARRAARQMVEQCYKDNSKRYLHPIIDWSELDVWEFIDRENLPYCELYDEGFARIGCIMCPLTSLVQRLREAVRWPVYAANYRAMCQRAFDYKKNKGLKIPAAWKSGDDMYRWWLSGKAIEDSDPAQQRFFFE